MKKTISIIALFIAVSAHAQIPNYVPANGLIGWWPFTGNANDSSGNGNNGTVYGGATLTTDRFGNANCAYSFDGVDDYIEMQLNQSQPFTTSIWVNYSNFTQPNQTVFQHKDNCSRGGGYMLVLNGNALRLIIHNCGQCSGGTCSTEIIVSNITTLTANTWYNFVFISDGTSSISIYLNGQNIYQLTNPNAVVSYGTQPFTIGKWHDTPDLYFTAAKKDDIGYWNRVLTQSEITALFLSCNNPPAASIIPSGPTTFCDESTVTLTAVGGSTYEWSNDSTTQSISVSQSGNYGVTVTDSIGCSASASQSVTVNPLPNVTFSLPAYISNSASPFSLNGTPNGGTYTGAGVSINTLSPAAAGLGNKQFTYSYTDGNGCSNSAQANTIVFDTTGAVCSTYDTLYMHVVISGISPPNNTSDMKVYPNPAANHIIVDNGNYSMMTGYSLKITSSIAQIMFSQSITQQFFDIDVSVWGNGIYTLVVLDASQNVKATKQIVLQ